MKVIALRTLAHLANGTNVETTELPSLSWLAFSVALATIRPACKSQERLGTSEVSQMSLRLMSTVWDLRTESHTQKLVLLALADNANDEGVCWPSLATIGRKCNLDPSNVTRHLNRLIELGFIVKSKRHTKEGRRTSNNYKLNLSYCNLRHTPSATCLGGASAHRTTNPHLEPPKERKKKISSISPDSNPEKQKRQRVCHQAHVAATGVQTRYEFHSKLWKAFDDAGYSAQDVTSVIAAKKSWNAKPKHHDCQKSLGIEKLIGNLANFDEELGKYRSRIVNQRCYRAVQKQRVELAQKPSQLPPPEEFKAGLEAMRKAL